MKNIPETSIWMYELTVPTIEGIIFYTIYVEDINNNWNSIEGSFEITTGNLGIPNEPSNLLDIIILIGLLIGILFSISVVVTTRLNKRRGDERSNRSSVLIRDQTTLIKESSSYERYKKTVAIHCPTCENVRSLSIPISIGPTSGGICSVFISKNLVCEHSFKVYVDINHGIRGYEPVDYSVGEEIK